MSWIRSKGPFIILIILGFWIMVLSIFGVMFDKNWTNPILAAYSLIIILAFTLIFIRSTKPYIVPETVEEFEKSLKGGLFHFKCPSCNGYFAVKKSKRNNKKIVKMNCPDCGIIGVIPPYSTLVLEEEIPEKKSIGLHFRCLCCGEGITVWSEGTQLHQNINVYTCPFCGVEQELKRI